MVCGSPGKWSIVDRSVVGGFNKTANIGICFLYSPISRDILSKPQENVKKKKKKEAALENTCGGLSLQF